MEHVVCFFSEYLYICVCSPSSVSCTAALAFPLSLRMWNTTTTTTPYSWRTRRRVDSPQGAVLFFLLLFSVFFSAASAQGPVCIITNQIVFTQDVGTSNCTMGQNVSLCSLYSTMNVLAMDVALLSSDIITLEATVAGIQVNVSILQINVTTIELQIQGILPYVANGTAPYFPCNISLCQIRADQLADEALIAILQANVSTLFSDVFALALDVDALQVAVADIQGNYVTTNTSQYIAGTKTFGPCNQTVCDLYTLITELISDNSTYVTIAGTQTISGAKNFTKAIRLSASSDQITFGPSLSNAITLNVSQAATGPWQVGLPDPGADAYLVMTETLDPQTIDADTLFSSPLTFTAGGNQIVFLPGDTGFSLTLNGVQPASASWTVNLQDPGDNTDVVYTRSQPSPQIVIQSIQFAGEPAFTFSPTAHFLLWPGGTGNFLTIGATTPSITSMVTVPDPGNPSASFVLTETAQNQTIDASTFFSTTLHLSASVSQLELGAGVDRFTLTAPAPGQHTTLTIPDPGTATASFLLSAGPITITGPLTITDTTNQIVFGTGQTITLNVPTPAASETVTLPDPGFVGSVNLVLTNSRAGQIIAEGSLFFTGVPTFDANGPQQFVLVDSTSGNSLGISIGSIAVNHHITFVDPGSNTGNIMMTQTLDPQIVDASTTFTTQLTLSAATDQLSLQPGGSGNNFFINVTTPGQVTQVTIPDPGQASAYFLLSAGATSMTGPLTITATSNQLVFGTGHTITLNVPTPGATHTMTLPDPGGNVNLVMTNSLAGQTVADIDFTFSAQVFFSASSAIYFTAASPSLLFGTASQIITLTVAQPVSSHTVTLPDPGGAANIVLTATAATQTIGATTVFSTQLTLSAATSQLVLGSGTDKFTITAPAPGQATTITIGDPGQASTNMAQELASSSGSFSFGTACGGTAGSTTAKWDRVQNSVTLTIEAFTCTSTTSSWLISTTGLPAVIQPARSVYLALGAVQTAAGPTNMAGTLEIIAGTGIMWIGAGGFSTFPASGTIGLSEDVSIAYLVV